MDLITTRLVTAQTRYAALRAHLRLAVDRLLEEPELGMEDIPWKMILMIGGGVIAVGIVVAMVTFVHAQLAQLPTNPGY